MQKELKHIHSQLVKMNYLSAFLQYFLEKKEKLQISCKIEMGSYAYCTTKNKKYSVNYTLITKKRW